MITVSPSRPFDGQEPSGPSAGCTFSVGIPTADLGSAMSELVTSCKPSRGAASWRLEGFSAYGVAREATAASNASL